MDMYKEYMYRLRKLSFVDTYIKIHGNVTPKLKHYVYLLNDLKLNENSYRAYYGEIKKTVNSFINCWTKTIDEAIRIADKYTYVISREDLVDMVETTISLNQSKQIDFARDFLPVKSQIEKEAYEEVEELYNKFMERMYELKNEVNRLDKQDKVEYFAKEHFPMSLKKKNEVFLFTHDYISHQLLCNVSIKNHPLKPIISTKQDTLLQLLEEVEKIRVSLEEIVQHARNNLKSLQEKTASSINSLLNQLYAKNKEHLNISRQETRSSLEIAEVQRSMEIIKDKIEDSKQMPISRLVEEFKYWQARIEEFNHITIALKKLHEAETKLLEDEKTLNNMECREMFRSKTLCWEETVNTLQANLRSIRNMKTKAGKALMTFFSVRGPDRVIHSDTVGPYYVDDYGHQVYFFEYGLKVFHVDCVGKIYEAKENEKYYYDQMGRYIYDSDGSKLYQIAPCSSTYKLKDDIFEKHTEDCGHSTREVAGCRMTIKDPRDVSILPVVDAVDLSEILDPDTSKYLWESFGHVLPRALRDVAAAKPKNPIHHLAHKLLYHKYSKSRNELGAMKKEAEEYRDKIFQDRRDKAVAASKAWRAKQVKRRKPEEFDDTLDRHVHDARAAAHEFIRALNCFDD